MPGVGVCNRDGNQHHRAWQQWRDEAVGSDRSQWAFPVLDAGLWARRRTCLSGNLHRTGPTGRSCVDAAADLHLGVRRSGTGTVGTARLCRRTTGPRPDWGSTQRCPWLSCRCFQGSYVTAGGALSTAACRAQKSVTRAASSVGHSSEGRARDPVRTAERASFIAAVVSAHSEGLHSPRSSVAIIRVGHLTRAAAQAKSVLLRTPEWTVRAMAPRLARDMGATSASTASGSVRRVRSVSIPSSSPWRTGPRIPMARYTGSSILTCRRIDGLAAWTGVLTVIRLRTSSGRAAASCNPTWPPHALPNQSTGPADSSF